MNGIAHSGWFKLTCPPKKLVQVEYWSWAEKKGGEMDRRKHTAEQVINKLREAEVAISTGST